MDDEACVMGDEEADVSGTGLGFNPQGVAEIESSQARLLLEPIQKWVEGSRPDYLCLAVQQPEVFADRPFLTICNVTWFDGFLRDSSPVKINVFAASSSTLILQRLTYNRQMIHEAQIAVDDWPSEVAAFLDQGLTKAAVHCCHGHRAEEHGEVFQRLRKADWSSLVVESFENRTLYRSRQCRYVVSPTSSDHEAQCEPCQELMANLQTKYPPAGLVAMKKAQVEPTSTPVPSQKRSKRGRGRPRKLADPTTDEADPSPSCPAEPLSTIEEDAREGEAVNPFDPLTEKSAKGQDLGKENISDVEEKPEEDDNWAMEDDPNDEDFDQNPSVRPRRGKRRASSVKFKEQMALFVKRKRGRPPTITDPVTCPDCGETFTILKDFRIHCQEHANTIPCEFPDCTRRLRNHRELDIHMRKHRGEKPFACSECDKAYLTRQDLRTHMRSHTGVRPYHCKECPKRFARYQQLKIHMVVHTGEKSYLCPECGGAFGSDSTLIDHRKRKHLEMRDHKCQFCHKGFFTRQEMEAHSRTHTGDKPFQCGQCGKNFSRAHHLKRHMEGVHQGTKQKKYGKSRELAEDSVTIIQQSHSKVDTIKVEDGDEDHQDQETLVYCTDERGNTMLLRNVHKTSGSTEYLVEGDPNMKFTPATAPDGTSVLIQNLTTDGLHSDSDGGAPQSIQYATLSGAAATSLLELSQAGRNNEGGESELEDSMQDTIFISEDSVVEIPGQEGGYILVTTEEDGEEGATRLVPVKMDNPPSSVQSHDSLMETIKKDEPA